MSDGIQRETTVVAKTVTRIVVPLILVTAIALLLQGHNLPGGGFIAGVLTATAFALTYIIYGLDYIQTELLDRGVDVPDGVPTALARESGTVFGIGLAIAAGGGIAAMVLGYPFLTQAVAFLEHLPVYHELEVASAFVFDLGVYFVVVGGLLTILSVVGAE
ncbi:MnhB domain-containing protein [Haloarculaceae archaeon H-GB2-1]|nr:MnhB domain-containing protein [Haloarculaceae archaeon H-GB1-1]MEA5385919.1 MnhB domain-containing protein [Haloarculaceae archaeon H-GB11]MEA5407426.1 MnhB domain-containing protein [Haloarculaceae archaeon H-GB2-1]